MVLHRAFIFSCLPWKTTFLWMLDPTLFPVAAPGGFFPPFFVFVFQFWSLAPVRVRPLFPPTIPEIPYQEAGFKRPRFFWDWVILGSRSRLAPGEKWEKGSVYSPLKVSCATPGF